jgi:nitroimidazol reductase NimA-like FMN-containing flavoprotein (pyridoxamine 5'-phosphate oxidase superfamily)
MSKIRYQNAACIDPKLIQLYLQKIPTAIIALSGNDQPYMVPVNFTWLSNKIYFHGADAGRKHDMIKANPKASISIFEENGFTISPVPAHVSIGYFSVYMEGEMSFVDSPTEKLEALQSLLDKCVPNYYSKDIRTEMVEKYRSSLNSKTEVYVFTPTFITAKQSESSIDNLYFGGRTREFDSTLDKKCAELIEKGLVTS